MMNKKLPILMISAIIALVATQTGCKKYADPPPYFEETPDTAQQVERKILIIGIDGASGIEYKKIQPAVMMQMKAHSKFSWEAVSDEVTTDAASWKTLLSGVSFTRHSISDSSMIYTLPPGSTEHQEIVSYPTFLGYLLGSSRSDTRIGVVSSWQTLISRLFPEATDQVLVPDDKAVKDSAVALVKRPKSDVVFVHFNDVAEAGIQYGFSAEAQGYADAVNQTDQYIGNILEALKSRPGYNTSEEWLVVVMGTHGGIDSGYGGASVAETTVPVFYYNENFLEKELVTEGLFTGVEIRGQGDAAIRATLLNSHGYYNPGTGEQTVQLKVKGTSGYYPHFFSCMSRWPGTAGWSMFTAGADWAMSIRSDNSGEIRAQSNNQPAFDGTWHTISFTIADSSGRTYLRRYTDGIRNETRDISSIYNDGGSVIATSSLMLGWGADPGMGSSTFNVADIMIFNTALTDQEILNSICMEDISQHAQYDHLIGYWPGNDGFGGRLKNKAPGQQTDFILSGGFQWNKIADMPCTFPGISSPGKESLLVKSVDLAPIFFYWLRIDPSENWHLEGTNWLDRYEIEFVKL